MSFLAKVGEKLYEFESRSDLYKARAFYVDSRCKSQGDLENFLEDSRVEYYLVDPESLH